MPNKADINYAELKLDICSTYKYTAMAGQKKRTTDKFW